MATARHVIVDLQTPDTRWGLGNVQRPPLPVFVAAFSALYFLAAKLGIATSLPPEGIVTVWPPNAIVLAALLTVARKHWWAFFVATVATEIVADVPTYPFWAAVGYGAVNFFEAALAAFVLLRFGRDIPPIAGVSDFTRFIVIGPVLASGTAALFGAAIYKLGSPDLDYLHYWRVFWFGDALGLLIVGTCLLSFFRVPRWWHQARLATALEAAVLTAGFAGAIAWAFFSGSEVPRLYLVFPFLLWAAVRFGAHGACVAVLATVGSAIASAAAGVGPFFSLSAIDRVVSLQSLSVIVALSTFLLAFTIEDFWRADARLKAEVREHSRTAVELSLAKRDLEERNRELDNIVAERTSDLRVTLGRNEVLLHEMYHRIKNSLQMITGMITLQGRTGSAQDLLPKITNQIGAIAATYDMMHRMDSVEEADLFPIVSELCGRTSQAAGGAVNLTCETHGEAVVAAGTAVSVALALNELVANSIKHSNLDGGAVINVCCRREGRQVVFTITDSGPGFPADFDVTKASGFGLRMARRVVSQVGGEIHLTSTSTGSRVEVLLPITRTDAERS